MGTCSSCGDWPVEGNRHGESICCGSYLIPDDKEDS